MIAVGVGLFFSKFVRRIDFDVSQCDILARTNDVLKLIEILLDALLSDFQAMPFEVLGNQRFAIINMDDPNVDFVAETPTCLGKKLSSVEVRSVKIDNDQGLQCLGRGKLLHQAVLEWFVEQDSNFF